MGSIPPPTERKPLHEVLPPLVLGTATFNHQYVSDPLDPQVLPALSIVSRTLELGINAFDTSPYYGPSEVILGKALADPSITSKYSRESYLLVTKAGRIAGDEFDYSPAWVRYSVHRSLERLHTPYLDLVYMHDVEFVSADEVLGAVQELRRLRDEGLIRYVGISGYPVKTLCSLAEMILEKTGKPLDAVMNYCHFSIQNTMLATSGLERLKRAGVDVVPSASMLGMGLLTTRGVDGGPMAVWHPSPPELRKAVREMVEVAKSNDEKMEVVAIRWALDNWSRDGAPLGGTSSQLPAGTRVGVSVMGVSNVAELEETWRVFRSVIEGLNEKPSSHEMAEAHKWSLERRTHIQGIVEKMWEVLGEWRDYSWNSPDAGFVNTRKKEDFGVVPQDEITLKYAAK
jgi:D-arabinose 1-dehydrogenase